MAWKQIPGNPNWQFNDAPPVNNRWANMTFVGGVRTDGDRQIYAQVRRNSDPDGTNRGELSATFYNAKAGVIGRQLAAFYTALPAIGAGGGGGGGGGGGAFSVPIATANPSAATLSYTIDNPNAYGTSANDQFGNGPNESSRSVQTDGTHLIVGANREDDAGGSSSGVAYIFDASDGTLLHTLTNPNAYSTSAGDDFGYSVAILGNYAVVGAHGEDDAGGSSSGKAYIYNVTTGALLHTLSNPNSSGSAASDNFGYGVHLNSTHAFVSASSQGTIYAFNLETGVEAFNFSDVAGWGYDFAVDDTYIVVGHRQYNSNSGRVYIYSATDGSLVRTIENPNPFDGTSGDNFGYGVDISEGYIVAGSDEGNAPVVTSYGSYPSNRLGYAYVFEIATGSLISTMINPNPDSSPQSAFNNNDGFARRNVAISGEVVVVGSYNHAAGSTGGQVYLFDRTTGSQLLAIPNPNGYNTGSYDYFGTRLDIAGDVLYASAYGEDDASGTSSGKVYALSLS